MRLEDMKNNIPETPDFIHKMVQEEVNRQLQDTKAVSIKKRKWNKMQVAAAAAVCLLATSTVAYAGSRLYHMYVEKQGTYSVATGLQADGNTTLQLPEQVHDVTISTSYIPDGMTWTDDAHLQYNAQNGGFSFTSVLLDSDDFAQVKEDKNIVESEERTFGQYEGVYLKYHEVMQDGFFNQRIYLLCPEAYRVITIYVGDDVSKEDAIKVAENLQITEKDTMIDTANMYTWSDIVSPEETPGDEEITSIAADKLPIAKVGETINLTASGEDTDGNYVSDIPLQATVDSVQITDDLQLLNGQIPEDWKDATDADGKLKENTISYIKEGDGVNTLDEIVKTKTEQQKLVYTTVTYTNTSDQEVNHILYIGSLMKLHSDGSTYEAYVPEEESGDGYDRTTWDSAARTGEMKYYSVTDNYGNGGNYIPTLKPGESIQISMAWIVNESDLTEAYLNLNGSSYQFNDETLASGVIDIRQE